MKLNLAFSSPPPVEPDFDARLHGPDQGLINAWLAGIAMRGGPEQKAAERGELPLLPFKGGIEPPSPDKPIPPKKRKKTGSLWYFAALQGLRGNDLNIDTESHQTLVCSLTGVEVNFILDTQKLLKQI